MLHMASLLCPDGFHRYDCSRLAARLRDAGVPFLFKQWGGRTPKAGGRELDGRTWDQYPDQREIE
jgi:protein gp37